MGTGGTYQKALQAATAAIQGLAGNNLGQALAGGASPYLAGVIKELTTDPQTHQVDIATNTLAHAILGAVAAEVSGNNALSGAAGAASGELAAQVLITQLYSDGAKVSELTEEQKQTISTLSTLAAGLAGGIAGDSTASAITGAQAGKNATDNNFLGKLITEGCAIAAPCRAKVAEKVLEIGVKAGITGIVAKEIADKISSEDLDHLIMLQMMGNDEITQSYLNTLQDKYTQVANPTNLPTHTGGDQSGDIRKYPNHTGNTEGKPDVGSNTTVTPIPDGPTKDELIYLSDSNEYVPSPKHAPGGWGTPMDLTNSKAQEVLNNSIQGGKQRYGIADGNYMSFSQTMPVVGMVIQYLATKPLRKYYENFSLEVISVSLSIIK